MGVYVVLDIVLDFRNVFEYDQPEKIAVHQVDRSQDKVTMTSILI